MFMHLRVLTVWLLKHLIRFFDDKSFTNEQKIIYFDLTSNPHKIARFFILLKIMRQNFLSYLSMTDEKSWREENIDSSFLQLFSF